jgi:hypothetical protein
MLFFAGHGDWARDLIRDLVSVVYLVSFNRSYHTLGFERLLGTSKSFEGLIGAYRYYYSLQCIYVTSDSEVLECVYCNTLPVCAVYAEIVATITHTASIRTFTYNMMFCCNSV